MRWCRFRLGFTNFCVCPKSWPGFPTPCCHIFFCKTCLNFLLIIIPWTKKKLFIHPYHLIVQMYLLLVKPNLNLHHLIKNIPFSQKLNWVHCVLIKINILWISLFNINSLQLHSFVQILIIIYCCYLVYVYFGGEGGALPFCYSMCQAMVIVL
jgi:hypothetical protein